MDFYIITRVTRLENLSTIFKTIFNTSKFNVTWYISFDTNIVKEINTDILNMVQIPNCILKFIECKNGDYGYEMINIILDEIKQGFIYILDDDNILHEDFYDDIYKAILDNPDKKGFVFNQKVDGKDFTKLDIRIASPENMKVQKIDIAQYVLKRE